MNNSFEITGIAHKIGETQQVTDSFQKRELVLKIPNDNPQYQDELVPFEFVQKNVNRLDYLEPGCNCLVKFNLSGREWANPKTGEIKTFGSLKGWFAQNLDKDNTQTGGQTGAQYAEQQAQADAKVHGTTQQNGDEPKDDLPF